MPEILTISGPLSGSNPFVFSSMTAREELGRPFEFDVELLSEQGDVNLTDVLGQGITIRVPTRSGGTRFFHGLVSRCLQGEPVKHQFRYKVVLRPWLWFLTRTADCRIFQAKSTPEIIKQVFSDQGFSDFQDKLSATYQPWEYCVQYRETAFDFVSRLMEHAGIYYFFSHEEGKHNLVLCDGADSHGAAEGSAKVPFYPPSDNVVRDECVFEWENWFELQPVKMVLKDYYFETPSTSLLVQKKSQITPSLGTQEVYDYPGAFRKIADGEMISNVRVETWGARYERLSLRSNAGGLGAGWLFTLENHPRANQNREYLIVNSSHDVTSHITRSKAEAKLELDHVSQHQVIPSATVFRPEQLTVKPFVRGPQTAVVVGPSGHEIYSDKYGRVKVQFHWDRLGKSDENSSCWIRVSQSWAGKKWGAMFLPRVGHEVVVDFLEGDPDQPIITGAVYNADQVTPYTLPDDQTKSGIKTHSSKDGNDETYNELRFEDKKGAEEIYFHAERDFLRIVENNDVLKVGLEVKDAGDQTIVIHNNQTVTIGNKDSKDGSQKSTIWKDQSITIGKDQTIKIGFGGDGSAKDGGRKIDIAKDHVVTIGNDETVEITKNRTVTIKEGNEELTVSQGNQKIAIKAGASSLEAAKEILLKVGGNSIKIDTQGITLEGIKIVMKANTTFDVEGGAKLTAKAPMTDVLADAILTLKGGLVKIN